MAEPTKKIWNEGRVVGYSAYELLVKHAETMGVTPPTFQEWLSASLGPGTSILVKIDPTTAEEQDAFLRTGTYVRTIELTYPNPDESNNLGLCGANPVVMSLFDGKGYYKSGYHVASEVTDYGYLASNMRFYRRGSIYVDAPSPTHTAGVIPHVKSALFEDYDPLSDLQQRVDCYTAIVGAVLLTPGEWDDPFAQANQSLIDAPAEDVQVSIADSPSLRLWFNKVFTTGFEVLLTGFTSSSVYEALRTHASSIISDATLDLSSADMDELTAKFTAGATLGPQLMPYVTAVTVIPHPLANRKDLETPTDSAEYTRAVTIVSNNTNSQGYSHPAGLENPTPSWGNRPFILGPWYYNGRSDWPGTLFNNLAVAWGDEIGYRLSGYSSGTEDDLDIACTPAVIAVNTLDNGIDSQPAYNTDETFSFLNWADANPSAAAGQVCRRTQQVVKVSTTTGLKNFANLLIQLSNTFKYAIVDARTFDPNDYLSGSFELRNWIDRYIVFSSAATASRPSDVANRAWTAVPGDDLYSFNLLIDTQFLNAFVYQLNQAIQQRREIVQNGRYNGYNYRFVLKSISKITAPWVRNKNSSSTSTFHNACVPVETLINRHMGEWSNTAPAGESDSARHRRRNLWFRGELQSNISVQHYSSVNYYLTSEVYYKNINDIIQYLQQLTPIDDESTCELGHLDADMVEEALTSSDWIVSHEIAHQTSGSSTIYGILVYDYTNSTLSCDLIRSATGGSYQRSWSQWSDTTYSSIFGLSEASQMSVFTTLAVDCVVEIQKNLSGVWNVEDTKKLTCVVDPHISFPGSAI